MTWFIFFWMSFFGKFLDVLFFLDVFVLDILICLVTLYFMISRNFGDVFV